MMTCMMHTYAMTRHYVLVRLTRHPQRRRWRCGGFTLCSSYDVYFLWAASA